MTPAEQRLKPCLFCGGTELITGSWCIDDDEAHELVKAGDLGEVPSIECNRCLGSAPAEIWNRRPDPWRYPPDMPEDGQQILHTYAHPAGEKGPIIGTYNAEYQAAYYYPIVRWRRYRRLNVSTNQ